MKTRTKRRVLDLCWPSLIVDGIYGVNLTKKKALVETMKNSEGKRERERESESRSEIVLKRSWNPLTCEKGRRRRGSWTREVVRCDSAGSVASGWENETLPGAVNALGRETGSASGMARLLSKPKPPGISLSLGIDRKVIGEVRLTLIEASNTMYIFFSLLLVSSFSVL